jgi:SAM-dependent methyltransferase
MIDDQRRADWNERHGHGWFEGEGPNAALQRGVAHLPVGTALDLATGGGTNAVWLASIGWQVTAVDWSPVALANGRAEADRVGVSVDWLKRDLFTWSPTPRSYDLVTIVYLHLPPNERRPVYVAAADAVAPGGRLAIVGHDRLNATEGEGGPPDDGRLFTPDELTLLLRTDSSGFEIERAETIRRVPPPARGPIDALLVARRQ